MKYGKLTIIDGTKRRDGKSYKIYAICDCGTKKEVLYQHLKEGRIKSCGCLRKEGRISHGFSRSNTYSSWRAMLNRCNKKNNSNYHYYGGRGIKVCKRWLEIKNFLKDMGERPEGMSLDRIDNNGNYCKKNCRWATSLEQSNNKRTSVYLTLGKVTKTISEWSRELNISSKTLYARVNTHKWSDEKALTKSIIGHHKNQLVEDNQG